MEQQSKNNLTKVVDKWFNLVYNIDKGDLFND